MAKVPLSPADLRSVFGANLRHLSKKYPSISELTRQLSINRTQFNRYLSGESFPRPDILDRICSFFNVDARILLEPVNELETKGKVLNGQFLKDFLGPGVSSLSEQSFPSGIYRFSRRSFIRDNHYLVGLSYIFRSEGVTYVKGFEPKEAMRHQGLPSFSHSREFRGYATRQDDGVALIIARRGALTCSFNYLARVASLENNFWVGYVSRTVREGSSGIRVTKMVYEHLGGKFGDILGAARGTGFVPEAGLMPFHHHLLQITEPFH
ncbi:helix-turn-helix domain-containing protein [Parasedimentitalea psychrophila]|uniref:Helix-turn-helix transcriptional regulator n=1 Tax=Parasedimentitalea psychrophila TaxID=2997337 RepID=A0A9Y2L1E0_9RHOB|nr:helix-turn-helix transcriptional regulator [Parasedimentitalea psychrophila]WIY25084.1 helix-turn-helix transcriptional regulator [Parasedimentitalea psychrophila]